MLLAMNANTPEERITRIETTLEHLATKGDVLALKVDMQALETRLVDRMGEMERRLMNWWLTTLVVIIGGFGTVIGFLYTHLPK